MRNYFFRRFIQSLFTIFLIATVTFFMMRSIPGGPFTRERPVPDEIMRALNAKYNLDAPLIVQYFDYMKSLLTFNLGPSFSRVGVSVNKLIGLGFPATAKIGFLAVLLIILVGIPVGIVSALKQNRPVDYFVMFMATLGVTIPNFVIATLYIYLFAGKLGWVPSFGLRTPWAYIGPILALSGYSLSFVARLTRSSMLEVLRQDYIRTARANGLKELSVIGKHAMRNALIPVITYLGPTIALLMTGSFVIERIFAIPGIGRYFVESVSSRDYTVIMGVTVLYASFYVLMIYLVDVLYAMIDPRIRFDKEIP
ncbi:Oligopeptide transport system permease protein OppB (TC 3.A.1.5.1) [Olavius algarvensis spirochete endosymbiont]|uniref:ABC transporter permease n=1 Tax=Olavius algarvensis spirochete endosymbiont TaxID=260710 RepID=UPI000F1A1D34|nr:ABC transporter permease [Olavius algarvensis spirochete endosymbiont]CAD7838620.1 MAG: Oligopeptide ABC transporter, permease protein OppB (TC 3.A.1.5.1) [Olavius algarvensis spirochete endosymbiont]VDA99483.1 Oligopeptide transport system permease protein OppB (TC 3.A.1.5.1) [Olavius algarvensis spirochete endosymbiont]